MLVAIVVATSYSLPSVFVTVLVLCTLADAPKARQTEYYTNTRLRRPSTVPCHPYTFLNYQTSTLLLSVRLLLFSDPSLFLRKDAILPCECFTLGETERGN